MQVKDKRPAVIAALAAAEIMTALVVQAGNCQACAVQVIAADYSFSCVCASRNHSNLSSERE